MGHRILTLKGSNWYGHYYDKKGEYYFCSELSILINLMFYQPYTHRVHNFSKLVLIEVVIIYLITLIVSNQTSFISVHDYLHSESISRSK